MYGDAISTLAALLAGPKPFSVPPGMPGGQPGPVQPKPFVPPGIPGGFPGPTPAPQHVPPGIPGGHPGPQPFPGGGGVPQWNPKQMRRGMRLPNQPY